MKIKQLVSLVSIAVVLFASCGQRQVKNDKPEQKQEQSAQVKFFNHFKTLEGKSFSGKEVFAGEGVSSWADLELVMTVRECHDTIVYIPFRVGENTSRTWMVIMENGEKLRFRHDHRHEDGTPEDLTMYGGYALDGGTPFKQIFPADEYTCNMLERICDNEWTVEFSEDLSTYSYSLKKDGNLVIQVDFDLTKPL
ncbi:MAG: hypothetical protein PHD00_12080 [Bacteroidales bacterium]|nr:hypothetical protein [Bacteroidales bacterium]MDD4673696.1 hypothetical protein [Bacteroidales bacterium]MDY0349337.1 hypothetical protein [Tenuifilaceae bacterium]